MSTVEQRLRKLELIHGGKNARLIVVSVPAGFDDDGPSDELVEAFLMQSGIRTTERDLVVTVLSRRGADEAAKAGPTLLMVRDR